MTKKAILIGLTAIVLAIAAPSFAQGPFADVPVDHWAYDAVSQLQEQGIIVGYPDGSFSGKRQITRYEFALALSRAIPVIKGMIQPVDESGQPISGVDEAKVKAMIDEALKGVTPGGVDALSKTINEFKDDLAGIGVSVDALKKDVAALDERVSALEAEHKRLKITGQTMFGFIGEDTDRGTAFDKDGRPLSGADEFLKALTFVRDADVIFDFTGAGGTKGKVVLNAGNYWGGSNAYLNATGTGFTATNRLSTANSDNVNLVLAYGSVPFLGGEITAGRFPIQFTKWTLKKIDVDSYFENWKTEDGGYYMDGVKGVWNWGGVNVTAFGAKNSGNASYNNFYTFGALNVPEQSAGVRATFGLAGAKVGLNFLAAGEGPSSGYKDSYIYGADAEIGINLLTQWTWTAAYTESQTRGFTPTPDVDKHNYAWEVQGQAGFGAIGLNVGYKEIRRNFSAPGDYSLVGAFQNLANIKGPEVGLSFGSGPLTVSGYGAFYTDVQNVAGFPDKIEQLKAAVGYKLGNGSVNFDGEWVKWKPGGGAANTDETYLTVSYSHSLADNAKMKLLYSWIDYKSNLAAPGPWGGADYRGALAGAQVSMGF